MWGTTTSILTEIEIVTFMGQCLTNEGAKHDVRPFLI